MTDRREVIDSCPAYHLNKEHWCSVILDGTVPEDVVKRLIGESYDRTSDSP